MPAPNGEARRSPEGQRPHAARPWHLPLLGTILNQMVQSSVPNDSLDVAFGALSDATRRGILERLGQADGSIGELADAFAMSLTGVKKHVAVLEAAGLVTTEKVGRVRRCRLGPRRLEGETAWIARYRQQLEDRLDRLGAFLDRTRGTP